MRFLQKKWIVKSNPFISEKTDIWKKVIKEYDTDKEFENELNDNARKAKYDKLFAKKFKGTSFDFFSSYSLHDGIVLSINMINNIISETSMVDEDFYLEQDGPAQLEIKIYYSSSFGTYAFTLIYKEVSKLLLDHPSERPLFLVKSSSLGTWYYDEIEEIKDNIFRHEILFTSGATLLVEFKDFRYHIKKY